jgi:membrane-bound lytic murein transglycosylase A
MSRRLALVLVALILLALAFWLFLRTGKPPAEDRLVLEAARFTDLPGWRDDALAEALPAFLKSCARIGLLPENETLGLAGTAGDWRPVCAAAARVPAGDSTAARAFFEAQLRPMAVTNGGEPTGLFTGYYEALLQGSRTRHGRYTVPLYVRPPELVMVDLGRFREELAGQRIAGRVEEGHLVPYPERREIAAGALSGRELELVWVNSTVDAFFLEIQGSGRVRLDDGSEMRLGYAAQNGHPYFAIGRDLVERGALTKAEVSMQSIRKWLEEHPAEAPEVMARNRSYVFFQELEGDGPLGAQGVALTPGRSLAVDRKFLPLGVPVWLSGSAPAAREGAPERPLNRLLVAQDTGGAIRGPVRGDVFWGHGPEAAEVAGRMKHDGRLWVLLPKANAVR